MNSRTATFVLGALLSAGAVLGSAQASGTDQTAAPQTNTTAKAAGKHHKMDPDKQAAFLAKKLNLSPDQVSQIKPILADRDTQLKALKADTSASKDDRRAKAKGIMDDSKTKIEAVLNDQQKQQFEQMQAAQKAKHEAKAAKPGM